MRNVNIEKWRGKRDPVNYFRNNNHKEILMGAFCVFGVSKKICRVKAEKKTPTQVGFGKEMRNLSIDEWSAEFKLQSESLFLSEQKPIKISPEFDAPQFCRDWIGVAPSEVRMTRIMVRSPKLDDDGKPVLRKGAPVMTWVQYGPQ